MTGTSPEQMRLSAAAANTQEGDAHLDPYHHHGRYEGRVLLPLRKQVVQDDTSGTIPSVKDRWPPLV
ncbi:hypothetical protein E2C01_051130 [Portunus trituberculatus]|uniref:Uncharacterized protein n=1 Tax=Portunus trituberculatus TaxID=210409 RepID=A0A5B7GIR1_PORTR|nr:hypothetical protein [Portunus trituberculatus]